MVNAVKMSITYLADEDSDILHNVIQLFSDPFESILHFIS